MSVLILVENIEGNFKKKSLELVQYGASVAKAMGTSATALVLGDCSNDAMAALGAYGSEKIINITDARLAQFSARAVSKCITAAAEKEAATVIIAPHDTIGKSVAPMVASRLKAGLATGVISLPEMSNGFVVKRNVFGGKAFAFVNITTEVKVVTLLANSFPIVAGEGSATVESMTVNFDEKDFGIQVKEVNKVTGSVPLGEAELVVSGGRGMKGPENWGILENLAATIGAATACSRPVADSHWRPHHEHVGQTGGTIRPNLYIAIGISGAIQHLAGVNGSKTIVVINKDPEAPFFKAADYGVIGDAMEVTPKLDEAFKKFKASQH